MEKILLIRPLQPMSSEVVRSARRDGEVIFGKLVLAPGKTFLAVIEDACINWNEWRHRDFGGGFVAQHNHQVVPAPFNEIVETGVLTVQTSVGRGNILFVTRALTDVFKPLLEDTSLVGSTYEFGLEKARGGPFDQMYWRWRSPILRDGRP